VTLYCGAFSTFGFGAGEQLSNTLCLNNTSLSTPTTMTEPLQQDSMLIMIHQT
jgi:hypothetical protein